MTIDAAARDIPHGDGAVHRVPKRNLVSAAQIALQSGRLGISKELELAETLRREQDVPLDGSIPPWRERADRLEAELR